MRAGSLFSGVGGLDLGLHRAGLHHVFFCESDAWRRSVLAAHWPGVPIYDDVRAFNTAAWPSRLGTERRAVGGVGDASVADTERDDTERVDLLCGGFPCQDLSVAGNRAGLAGARSGLFHEYARIADALRPRWLLVENVPGLLSSNSGRDFGIVIGTLADIGYGLAWRILDSRFFGVPQRRRRVYIVGTLAHGDPRAAAHRAGQVLAVGTRCKRHHQASSQTREEVAGTLGRGAGDRGKRGNDLDGHGAYIAGPLGGGAGERGWAQNTERMTFVSLALNGKRGKRDDGESETFVTHALTSEGADASEDGTGRGTPSSVNGAGVRRLTPTECERLQNWPDNWTNPTGDAPDSRRYAAAGDGVTASVSEWIGRRLMAHD